MSVPVVSFNGVVRCGASGDFPVSALLRMTPLFLEKWNAVQDSDQLLLNINDQLDVTGGHPESQWSAEIGMSRANQPKIDLRYIDCAGVTHPAELEAANVTPMSMVFRNHPEALRALLDSRSLAVSAPVISMVAAARRHQECIVVLSQLGYRANSDSAFIQAQPPEDVQYLFSVYRELDLQAATGHSDSPRRRL